MGARAGRDCPLNTAPRCTPGSPSSPPPSPDRAREEGAFPTPWHQLKGERAFLGTCGEAGAARRVLLPLSQMVTQTSETLVEGLQGWRRWGRGLISLVDSLSFEDV